MNLVHKSLPQDFSQAELHAWLQNNCIESSKDEIKLYFKEEEIAEFEHESSASGREYNRLEAIMKEVSALIKKGNMGDGDTEAQVITIEIPVTLGMEMLNKQRRQNDDLVEKGYEVNETMVYGIVNEEDEVVEYFTPEGVIVAERTRDLSGKEKVKYLGVKNISIGNEARMAANE